MFGAKKERDPNLIKLEQSVFSRINQEIQKVQPELPDTAKNNVNFVKQHFRHEQAYLSKKIYDKNILSYWPDEWVPSFKYHCVPPIFMRFFKEPSIPLNAKIILFHGLPNPPDAIQGISGKWYRYIKPTPWIKDYWKE